MICLNCGAALDDKSMFCNVCGARQSQLQQPQMQPQQPVYQQPTYAQQVYQDRQKAMQYAESQRPAPQKTKKKFPVLVVAIAAAVLVLCAVALLLGLVFGKKTVYLVAEQVSEDQYGTTTYSYEYTEDGKLLSYQMEMEYNDDYSYLNDSFIAITYSYDKKGKLASLEYEVDGESYEYDYVYDKDGTLKTLEGEDQEFKIKCDDKGRITSVKSADDDSFSGKYAYHDNGILKKVNITSGGLEREMRYNEQGEQLSNEVRFDGNIISRTENKFDEDGRVVEYVTGSYSHGELNQTITVRYTYENGFPVTYEIEVEMEDESVTLIFETEDEGLERAFELADIELKGMDMGELMPEGEDALSEFQLELVYDEHGNMLELKSELPAMGIVNTQTHSYVAVKVPRNYAMIYQDPIYFQSIDPAHRATSGSAPAAEVPAYTEAAEAPTDAPAPGY